MPTGTVSSLGHTESRLSAGNKIADTPSRRSVFPVGNRLVDLRASTNGDRPQRIELTVVTAARKEIPMCVIAAPSPPGVPMLKVGKLFDHGTLLAVVVGRQADIRLVVQINADVDEITFGEEARNEVS